VQQGGGLVLALSSEALSVSVHLRGLTLALREPNWR